MPISIRCKYPLPLIFLTWTERIPAPVHFNPYSGGEPFFPGNRRYRHLASAVIADSVSCYVPAA